MYVRSHHDESVYMSLIVMQVWCECTSSTGGPTCHCVVVPPGFQSYPRRLILTVCSQFRRYNEPWADMELPYRVQKLLLDGDKSRAKIAAVVSLVATIFAACLLRCILVWITPSYHYSLLSIATFCLLLRHCGEVYSLRILVSLPKPLCPPHTLMVSNSGCTNRQ